MAVATFDTLKFANTLKAAGMPPQQAEAQAVAFAEVVQVNFKDLVTKDDLQAAVKELRRDMTDVRDELKRDIDGIQDRFEKALKGEVHRLDLQISRVQGELGLHRWMLGTTLAGVTAILVRLFFFKL